MSQLSATDVRPFIDMAFDRMMTKAELQQRVAEFRERLPTLLAAVERTSVPALPDHDTPWAWTTSSIVLHVIEELFQHAGHVDITADLLT